MLFSCNGKFTTLLRQITKKAKRTTYAAVQFVTLSLLFLCISFTSLSPSTWLYTFIVTPISECPMIDCNTFGSIPSCRSRSNCFTFSLNDKSSFFPGGVLSVETNFHEYRLFRFPAKKFYIHTFHLLADIRRLFSSATRYFLLDFYNNCNICYLD